MAKFVVKKQVIKLVLVIDATDENDARQEAMRGNAYCFVDDDYDSTIVNFDNWEIKRVSDNAKVMFDGDGVSRLINAK